MFTGTANPKELPLLCLSIARSQGGGYGIDRGGDRGLHSRPPFPFLLRVHDSGELRVAGRPRDAPPQPLRRPLGGGSVPPLLRSLLQPPFPHPHGHGLRFHGPRPPLRRPHHLLHWLHVPHRMHVYYTSGEALKEGGIDATGALMVLTLKVISCTINYSDGLLKEEDLREAQKKNRLIHCPSLFEYIGYCLCCGSHFVGPVYEVNDYLEWTEHKGIWAASGDRQSASLGAALRALLQAAICIGLYLQLVPHYPPFQFNEPVYYEWGFWQILFYQYMSGFTERWKYYFIWSISEASIIISGFGFSGWSDSSPPKALWGRAKNVDILGMEFATSAVQLPLVWYIHVSTWLRHYVYERLIQKGKKPGFFELLATQMVSAVWHGLYPGYIIFFVQSALMFAGSRVIYRWQQAVSPENLLFRKMLILVNFAYTLLVVNCSCIAFMVLSLKETLAAYQSVYFVGTIVPIIFILLGYVIKPARPARS